MKRIHAFLELVVQQGGSDLHLVAGEPPRIRIHGEIQAVRFRDLTADDMDIMIHEIMSDRQSRQLETEKAVDFAYEVPELGRFRANAYQHQHGLAIVLRVVPTTVRSLDDLDLPEAISALLRQPSGMSLVTGPTGSGKSTTLAAMLDFVNQTRSGHIITIEDPIEFRHEYKKSVVTQREIGLHAPSFGECLRNAMHEDPDLILVGEMRDLETMSLALTAAETGVQVMGSLHTNGAIRTIDRIINVFPAERQDLIRAILAESLRLVVSQQLVQNIEGNGRIAVTEILVNNSASSSMIRSGKTSQLQSVIQSGGKFGMRGMDAQLRALLQEGRITEETAYRHAIDKNAFQKPTSSAAA